MGFVYVIRLYKPLPVTGAQYYLGSTTNLDNRIQQHRRGKGSPMIKRAIELRIGCELLYSKQFETEQEARQMEARLKRWKSNKRALAYLQSV